MDENLEEQTENKEESRETMKTLFDYEKRKNNRIGKIEGPLSNLQFNLVFGGTLFWGFFINLIILLLFQNFFFNMNSTVLILGYFVLCLLGLACSTSTNPIFSFLGFNLIVVPSGGLLSVFLEDYGAHTIFKAIGIVLIIIVVMITAAILKPEWFEGLQYPLLIALGTGIVLEVLSMIFGLYTNWFDWIFVLIFAAYIGLDFAKAQDYDKTIDNAIDSAIDIYLDLINLFIRIVSILGKKD